MPAEPVFPSLTLVDAGGATVSFFGKKLIRKIVGRNVCQLDAVRPPGRRAVPDGGRDSRRAGSRGRPEQGPGGTCENSSFRLVRWNANRSDVENGTAERRGIVGVIVRSSQNIKWRGNQPPNSSSLIFSLPEP